MDFSQEDLDDEKTIEYIRGYLPQDLKERFTDDDLQYFLDVIDDYYCNSGILDAKPDDDGCISIDLEEIAAYVVAEAQKDGIGTFTPEEVLFVVQGEAEYTDSLYE